MFHLSGLQASSGFNSLLRLSERRDLLQTLLRQKLRAEGLRVRRIGLDAGPRRRRSWPIRRRKNSVRKFEYDENKQCCYK